MAAPVKIRVRGYTPVSAGDRRTSGILHRYHNGDHRSADPLFLKKNSRAPLLVWWCWNDRHFLISPPRQKR